MAATGIIPTVDYVVKRLFGTEDGKPTLISLLNAVLETAVEWRVVNIRHMRTIEDRERHDDKLVIIDLLCVDSEGNLFLIEVQVIVTAAFSERLLYYWAVEFRKQLKKGKDYSDLRPTILICITLETIHEEAEHFHQVYEPRSRADGHLFSDRMQIHTIDLSRFALASDELRTELEQWAYFFKHGDQLDPAAMPAGLTLPAIHHAAEVLDVISKTEQEREAYEHRLKVQRDLTNRDALLERKGEERGRSKGREEGRWIGRITALQEILEQPTTPIESLETLPIAELQRLAAELQRQVKARAIDGNPASSGD